MDVIAPGGLEDGDRRWKRIWGRAHDAAELRSRGGVQLGPADEQLVREPRELRALPFARDSGADQPHGPAARKLPFGPTTKHTRVELESYLRPEQR